MSIELDTFGARKKIHRPFPPEPDMIPTKLTKRTPCAHQGRIHPGFTTEDNPCLICAGNIRRDDDDIFMCPFEEDVARKGADDPFITVFRDSANMKYITATERYFVIRQRIKAEALKHV